MGVQTIPVDKIAGSVDRMVDFDRFFRPRRGELRDRVKSLKFAFQRAEMPPIAVYEVGGLYFAIDGHHRVALARESRMEFIDAEVTATRPTGTRPSSCPRSRRSAPSASSAATRTRPTATSTYG